MILQFITNGLVTGLFIFVVCDRFLFGLQHDKDIPYRGSGIVRHCRIWILFLCQRNVLPYQSCFILTVCLTMCSSLLLELTVYYPFKIKKASLNVVMIASIGVMTILVNMISLCFGNETRGDRQRHSRRFYFWGDNSNGSSNISGSRGFIALAVFVFFIRGTRLGIEIKALSSDEGFIRDFGIPYKTHETIRVFIKRTVHRFSQLSYRL